MASMVPDYIHPDCKSDAEKKLFFRFQDELPNNYVIFHSLGLAKHEKKLRSEIDFVVVNEKGILCIEVKGGGVKHDKGVWYFSDRYGEVHSRRESPFEQASSNMYTLRRSIEKRFGKNSVQARTIFGYIAIFPDIKFEFESPEWDLGRVVDRDKLHTKMKSMMKQQYDYSEKEIYRVTKGFIPQIMTEGEKNELVRFLRGDFHFVPSLSHSIEKSYMELLRLTEEQYDILDQLDENPRVVVHGYAGTGKTVLAVEKARRESRNGKEVMYVCFNRLLAKKIKSILHTEGFSEMIEVATLHSYAKKMIESANLMSSLEGVEGEDLYRKKYPELFAEAFVKILNEAPFDYLVIDEGQDLRYKAYLDILDWVLKEGLTKGRWIWMEDNQQNLFNPKKYDTDLSRYNPVYLKLTKNCRNTRPISILTSLISGTKLQKCLVKRGSEIKQIFYKNKRHQLRELENMITNLLGEGVDPKDIVILTPVLKEKSVIGETERLANLSLRPYDIDIKEKKYICYCTIQGFKGLESKALFVTDIEDLNSNYARSLNYVGISRAMSWLGIMISAKIKKQYIEKAKEFGKRLAEI